MRAHYVRNWCREIEKFRTDIGQPRASRKYVDIAAAGEIVFWVAEATVRRVLIPR